jgi:butyryl-CoA dehydrogenase
MDFSLTVEQEMIRNTAKEFAEKEIEPLARRIDKEDRIPKDVIRKMATKGFYGIPFPVDFGGVGADYISLVLVLEQIAQASAGVAGTIGAQALAEIAIYKYGNEKQRQKYLVPLLKGEKMGCFAFTEAATGSDPKAITTKAKLEGNEYLLNGSKLLISNSPIADTAIIFAKDSERDDKVSAFIVDARNEGFTIGKREEMLGNRGLEVAEIILNKVRVPKENMLGEGGDGYGILLTTISCGKVGTSAVTLGVMQAALHESMNYAKVRTQKGRSIAEFQTIQWLLAEMSTKIEAARWLVYRTAFLLSQDANVTKESAMTKLFVSEVADEVVRNAMQIHGAYGYTKDFKVERLYRDARALGIIEGVSEMQRVIIASQLR